MDAHALLTHWHTFDGYEGDPLCLPSLILPYKILQQIRLS
jgi:hypothetical protein